MSGSHQRGDSVLFIHQVTASHQMNRCDGGNVVFWRGSETQTVRLAGTPPLIPARR
ncbi:MAG: hypothetical protein P1P88_21815 [Bacteroidales bacterium]|nr:hypothetical protein [Bacteroidales bacterium]